MSAPILTLPSSLHPPDEPLVSLSGRRAQSSTWVVSRSGTDQVGELQIRRLDAVTPGLVRSAVKALVADGTRGLLLDLTGCAGSSEVEVHVRAVQRIVSSALPGQTSMAILVDARTEPAAGILATALRDTGRAVVVGTKSPGTPAGGPAAQVLATAAVARRLVLRSVRQRRTQPRLLGA